MLVGNLLLHQEYKRRWRAVKDLRDVFVRFNQAEGWYTQHQMARQPGVRRMWLEYLHALNLEQFDADVWKAMLAAHKRHPELSPATADSVDPISYCYRGMRQLFLVDGRETPPHLVTGNKIRHRNVGELLNFLFQWGEKEKRVGWGSKPYRLILQKTYEMIEGRLGHGAARQWLDEYFVLVRLTHWVLPYPSQVALLGWTK
ncbi:hypothetical protein T440DRAFT_525778 [Plenodomus tracheiphilus IPT5]|uniref:Uncharacterized protein n=1 Tax=Plenodomus tracheiphilus IPT5 TaxID=1408161 RepID=A0A6A7APS0_9PLEO|nr:hypothetical protein T440DRAFT_525778 [Plenodomus tracheiphilus IPT5]